jgi:3-oxoadipate enol-lactonase
VPKLNYISQGRGPTVVLSHALGCDLHMWDEVAARLERNFTVLRYDHRGHGRSEVPPGPYSIEAMADDAAALLDRCGDEAVHFVGISLGGMVAQQVAVRHPQLVNSIVVANSSSHFDETSRAMWRSRVETVLNLGVPAIADVALTRWFTPSFEDHPHAEARLEQLRQVLERTDPRAYAACCDAIARIEFGGSNPRIACPALVIAGAHDEATPPFMSEAIWKSISGAEMATLASAHLSAVERPVEFSDLVEGFIAGL